MSDQEKIRVGSRKSELALIQTNHVISLLKKCHPNKNFEIVTMNTLGDKVLDIPLPKIGEKSLFTKELESALANGGVDFVVHSLKDLPTALPLGMAIGAVLTREDPRDALVMQKDHDKYMLETLPEGSVIGTSSLRRAAQLAKKYPYLKVENIRGNLNTRLKKLDELGKYHGIILAAAGLIRMGWTSRITKILESDDILYAVGQGALAVECRESDEKIINLLKPLYDVQTALRVIAERSFLKTLGGGCSAPVAVTTTLTKGKDNNFILGMNGAVWSLDGQEEIIAEDSCTLHIKNMKRCATCPYAGQNGTTVCVNDIENLAKCERCPENSNIGNPAKKMKLDIEIELLKDDPHEHCPVEMPIGADFMGKCPFLELASSAGESSFTSNIQELQQLKQCPYRSRNIVPDSTLLSTDADKSTNFCGLVLHVDAGLEAFENAQSFGNKLAKNLMGKGATEIMAKAQATIHNSISGITTTVSA